MRKDEIALKYLERLGPYVVGAGAAFCGLIWHNEIFSAFSRTGMDGKDAVGAVFDVMVTLTAFLFSVFVLAIAPGGGFIEKIFRTTTFRIFKRYVVEALILGTLSAMSSLPFMSTNAGSGIWVYTFAQVIWGALAITAVMTFLRVIHIFIYWIGYDAAGRRLKRA